MTETIFAALFLTSFFGLILALLVGVALIAWPTTEARRVSVAAAPGVGAHA